MQEVEQYEDDALRKIIAFETRRHVPERVDDGWVITRTTVQGQKEYLTYRIRKAQGAIRPSWARSSKRAVRFGTFQSALLAVVLHNERDRYRRKLEAGNLHGQAVPRAVADQPSGGRWPIGTSLSSLRTDDSSMG